MNFFLECGNEQLLDPNHCCIYYFLNFIFILERAVLKFCEVTFFLWEIIGHYSITTEYIVKDDLRFAAYWNASRNKGVFVS